MEKPDLNALSSGSYSTLDQTLEGKSLMITGAASYWSYVLPCCKINNNQNTERNQTHHLPSFHEKISPIGVNQILKKGRMLPDDDIKYIVKLLLLFSYVSAS